MVRDLLHNLSENPSIYGIISTVVFFVIFIGMAIITFRLDKKYVDKLKNIPFEEKEKPLPAQKNE